MEVYDMRCPELFREDFNKGEFFSFGDFCRKISDPPIRFFEDEP